jgi:hypothetical protein
MTTRTGLLAQLVREDLYVVDADAVANAIVVRAQARRLLPEVAFQSNTRELVQSFRRARIGHSFRLRDSQRAMR